MSAKLGTFATLSIFYMILGKKPYWKVKLLNRTLKKNIKQSLLLNVE